MRRVHASGPSILHVFIHPARREVKVSVPPPPHLPNRCSQTANRYLLFTVFIGSENWTIGLFRATDQNLSPKINWKDFFSNDVFSFSSEKIESGFCVLWTLEAEFSLDRFPEEVEFGWWWFELFFPPRPEEENCASSNNCQHLTIKKKEPNFPCCLPCCRCCCCCCCWNLTQTLSVEKC